LAYPTEKGDCQQTWACSVYFQASATHSYRASVIDAHLIIAVHVKESSSRQQCDQNIDEAERVDEYPITLPQS
jgi:hypothetical protein